MRILMKYEFRKTLALKLLVLGVTAVAEILFLAGLYLNKQNLLGTSVFLLVMLAFGGVMIIGLGSILTLHRDMNTKQSYMLFMTPNNCYKILGAKVLENGLSILLAGAFFFGLGALDIMLLFAKEGGLQELWRWVEEIIHSFNRNIQLDAAGLGSLTFGLLTSWIATVTMAYLADVVSAALLNGKRFNGLLSFALFILLSLLLGWIQGHLGNPQSPNSYFLLHGAVALGASALMYVATAQIMERRLSV